MNTRLPFIATAIGFALLQSALPASAATFSVTRFDDPLPNTCTVNDCSLREAVIAANATTVEDTIQLQAGIYELTQTGFAPDEQCNDLDVTQPLQIIGQGSASTTIRNATPDPGAFGNAHESRVIDVHQSQLTMTGLTLRDGNVHLYISVAVIGEGGCLKANQSQVSLMNVEVTGCIAVRGGGVDFSNVDALFENVMIDDNAGYYAGMPSAGISFVNSSATFSNVVISNNHGGGLLLQGENTLTGSAVEVIGHSSSGIGVLSGTTHIHWSGWWRIADNSTIGSGGGIWVNHYTKLVISPVASSLGEADGLFLIENNTALVDGAGIHVIDSGTNDIRSELLASRLTLHQNSAGRDGGGIYSSGTLVLSDSELSFNSAGRYGGGVAQSGDETGNRIERSSFADNHAGTGGGAVYNSDDLAKLLNVSLYSNDAPKGGGVYAAGRGSVTRLVHVSSLSDTATQGRSLYVKDGAVAHLRNSALNGSCYRQDLNTPLQPGQIINNGGNAQRNGLLQDACAGNAYQYLSMSYGDFGGFFDVVGISSTSVLRNFTTVLAEAPVDVRNWDRDAQADSGAFEYGAAPD